MKIADSLRQECMPEMVYSLCKIAESKKYKKNDVQRLICLDSNEVDEYNKLFKFSEECGFISIDSDSIVHTAFSRSELENFKAFRNKINASIFGKAEKTKFIDALTWFLKQGNEVFSIKSAEEFAKKFPTSLNINNENYSIGFRFWVIALGFGLSHSIGSSLGSGTTLVFSTNIVIQEWLHSKSTIPIGESIPVKEFFNILTSDFPIFESCINSNNISLSLSIALRILNNTGRISLVYIPDRSDTWYLTKSKDAINKITDIIVREK